MCDTCGCGTISHEHDHHESEKIALHENIMSQNDTYAQSNKNIFKSQQILALNMLSSPGSGKTTILESTIKILKDEFPFFIIEGDQQTSRDADRISNAGARAVQINTGTGCHLDAHQISHVIADNPLENNSILIIENVGNLVCPSLFDLGEEFRVVILSVTEGEDKPIKYPHMFHTADVILINKIDLLPYLDFDIDVCKEYAQKINPKAKLFEISATTGRGMQTFTDWMKSKIL